MFRKFILIIILSLICNRLIAQSLSNIHIKEIIWNSDTLVIDSLSIVPNSIFIYDDNDKLIDDSLYISNYEDAYIIKKKGLYINNIKLKYRVIPFPIFKTEFNKDYSIIRERANKPINTYRYTLQKKKGLLSGYNQLERSGSISRGITFGNNQDVVLNSGLNLQMSGKISKDISVLAVISDENIPIQPEGNSQQLQEFDKVYIQLFTKETKLTAGDFEIDKPIGYFMNLQKRVQGAEIKSIFNISKDKETTIESKLSGAVSKGKFHKQYIEGQEGNQGAYKLNGANNEVYIIILAGSEKVYVDGKLLKRGLDNDYIIDYNTAEITFTSNFLITKDKRIVVEFEYSDKNYVRFLLFNSNIFRHKKNTFWVNVFSESDSKNQSIQQNLTTSEKKRLSEIGDSLNLAIMPSARKADTLSPDKVLYCMIDTLVDGFKYDSVFVYKAGNKQSVWQVSFSKVGENKGYYKKTNTLANGRVFEWISPENGKLLGDYMPVKLLIPPQKMQMVTAGGEIFIKENTKLNFEFSASNKDLNTFSTLHSKDNIGFAFNTQLEHNFITQDTSRKFIIGGKYRFIQDNFNTIEPFYDVEFERRWNLTYQESINEHTGEIFINYKKNKLKLNTTSAFLQRENYYKGFRNQLEMALAFGRIEIDTKASLLLSKDSIANTNYITHYFDIKYLFKPFYIGVRKQGEYNIWKNNETDSLLQQSLRFEEIEAYIRSSKEGLFEISYKNRKDYIKDLNDLEPITNANEFKVKFQLIKKPIQKLEAIFAYRTLSISDTNKIDIKPEENILTKLKHNLMLYKGAIKLNTIYEIGSGLEAKREYSYLEVTAGQGVYKWLDYNNNGVAELNEFEIANFQDEANYIRISTQSNDYVKVYSHEFSENFQLLPYRIWNKKKGWKKVLSKFSNKLTLRIKHKNILERIYLPFNQINDTALININSNIKNVFSFNRKIKRYGADCIFLKNFDRRLLANGLETNKNESWTFIFWGKPFKNLKLSNELKTQKKEYDSQILNTKNYIINSFNNSFTFDYQISNPFQLKLKYNYTEQRNNMKNECSFFHEINNELNWSIAKKGNLQTNFSYIKLIYNGDVSSASAYPMLQGFLPGNNLTWNLSFQRNISKNLHLLINYNGRKTGESPIVHVGSMQLRANF